MSAGMFAPRQHQRVNHALGSNRRLGRLLQLSIEKGNIKARVVRHERREESGKVEICGTIAGGGNRLKFTWEERGGPRVAAPTRSVVIGHGNALIYLPIFRHLQCSNNYQPHGTLQHGGAVWRWRIESSGEPRLPS